MNQVRNQVRNRPVPNQTQQWRRKSDCPEPAILSYQLQGTAFREDDSKQANNGNHGNSPTKAPQHVQGSGKAEHGGVHGTNHVEGRGRGKINQKAGITMDHRATGDLYLAPKPQRVNSGVPCSSERSRGVTSPEDANRQSLPLKLDAGNAERTLKLSAFLSQPRTGSSSTSQVVRGVIDLGDDPPQGSALSSSQKPLPQLKLSFKKNPAPVPSVITPEVPISASPGESFRRKPARKLLVPEEVPVFNATDERINGLGRTLSRILRHQAVELGLEIGNDGFCKVNQLLRLRIRTHAGLPICNHTVDDIRRVVAEDPKQRFSFKVEDGVVYMRANQGHSMKVVLSDQLLKEITDPDEVPICVHGTLKVHLPSIIKFGLNRMGRNHVHFATGLPKAEGVVSGMRETCEVLIYLDVKKALADGMKLYISDNKVVLTEGFRGIIKREYFLKVLEWPSMKVLPILDDDLSAKMT